MKFPRNLFYRSFIIIELVYILCFPILFVNVFVAQELLYQSSYLTLFLILFFFRISALFHILLIVLKRFYLRVIKANVEVKKANRKLLSVTIISSLLFCEIVFSFLPQSQGNTYYGLAQYIWHLYYGGPLNETGYRDKSIKTKIGNRNKKAFFLGDSFTYGAGIKKTSDRYSDIVAEILNQKISCFNLGRGHSDTKDELKRLKEFPYKPDIIIFQYYFNDIEPVALKYGYFPQNSAGSGGLFSVLSLPLRSSFFLNFLATNSLSFIPVFPKGAYRKEISKAFNDNKCKLDHLADIEKIISYCGENNIRLYVLLMPDLTDIRFSETFCFNKIKPVLEANQIEYISLENDLEKYAPEKLIVGKLDNHANEFTQKIIAKKIMEVVKEFN